MEDDERCCGTGTCIINAQGLCWCGQQWNGTTMCRPPADGLSAGATEAPVDSVSGSARGPADAAPESGHAA